MPIDYCVHNIERNDCDQCSRANVVKLVASTPPSPVDSECVALLEKMLAAAKEGKFNGVALMTVTSDRVGSYSALGTSFAGQGVYQNAHTAIGGCTVLGRRLERALLVWGPEDALEPPPNDIA